MNKNKYLEELDKVLLTTLKKQSSSMVDKNIIPVNDDIMNSGHIKKVAFDVYRVESDPYNDLWLLEDVNGRPHLVRASDPKYEYTQAGEWTVASDYDRKNVTLSYKNTPISRFSSSEYGFSEDEIFSFKQSVLERVASDESFVKEVFATQPKQKVESITSTHPELKKFI
jgi:hypothetical protein